MTWEERRTVWTPAGKRMLLARQVIAFQSWFSAGLWVAQAKLFTGDWAISSVQTLMLPLPGLLRNQRYGQIYTVCQRITFISFFSPHQSPLSLLVCTFLPVHCHQAWVGGAELWVCWVLGSLIRQEESQWNSLPQDLIWVSDMSTCKRYKINHLNS